MAQTLVSSHESIQINTEDGPMIVTFPIKVTKSGRGDGAISEAQAQHIVSYGGDFRIIDGEPDDDDDADDAETLNELGLAPATGAPQGDDSTKTGDKKYDAHHNPTQGEDSPPNDSKATMATDDNSNDSRGRRSKRG